jgi:hypothetical protein
MKIVGRLMIAAAVFAATVCLKVPASHASGDAPWCAVIELGPGEVYWDCEYRTVEECVPKVLAGNSGFCNLNPYGPGPYASKTAVHQKHQKPHA